MGCYGKRKYKKKCHKRKKSSCYNNCGKRYKRDKIVRTTKCQGGCMPTNSQIVQATQPFGGIYTKTCNSLTTPGRTVHNYVGNSLGGCDACKLGHGIRGITCGMDPRFDPLTSGACYGSDETHLHMDRLGNIQVHSHPGGDYSHSHDACGNDYYLGRVSDSRSLTRNPDCLDEDVLGGVRSACGTDSHCPVGQRCVGGRCCSSNGSHLEINDSLRELRYRSTLGSTRFYGDSSNCNTTLSDRGLFGGVRPYNGYCVGGFQDNLGASNCNSCSLTSASFCNGSTLGHCNVASSVPSYKNTLPPDSLNYGAKVPDLRGYQNLGLSCINGALCSTKRPTVCKTKIKEVYRC